jgi:Kef-type K+ transport system membrane component KefB
MVPTDLLAIFMLDLALVLLIAKIFGEAARELGQPGVIGEIVAGLLAGPTLAARKDLERTMTQGLPRRDTALLATLMNTRGLTELASMSQARRTPLTFRSRACF